MRPRCWCGGELEGPWVRFHRAPPFIEEEGHYVNEPAGEALQEAAPAPWQHPPIQGLQKAPERKPREPLKKWVPRYFAWMVSLPYPGQVAPPPGPVPPKPWSKEEELRVSIIGLLRDLGYDAHNLEQGHRPGYGGSRVSKGLPDVYVRGMGRRFWIETKRWDREHTPEQREWMLAELEQGGTYLLIYEAEQVARWHTSHTGE